MSLSEHTHTHTLRVVLGHQSEFPNAPCVDGQKLLTAENLFLLLICLCVQVVSLVDFLLQSQDVNRDGLLTPSELLSLPSAHTEVEHNTVHSNWLLMRA